MNDLPDAGDPIAYMVLEQGTPVVDSEGTSVGTVAKVLAVPEEDVFDGIAINTDRGSRFIDADQVGRLYERRAELKITAAEVAAQPEHELSAGTFEAEIKERRFGKDKTDWRQDQ